MLHLPILQLFLSLRLLPLRTGLVVDAQVSKILLDEELCVDVAVVVESLVAAEAVGDGVLIGFPADAALPLRALLLHVGPLPAGVASRTCLGLSLRTRCHLVDYRI